MKDLKIRNLEKGLTVYVDSANRDGTFRFKSIVLDREPNTIYKNYVYTDNQKIDNTIYKGISQHIIEIIKSQAEIELNNYIAQNIHKTDFYTKQDEYNQYTFFEYVQYTEPEFQTNYNTYYNNIQDGIIDITINSTECQFDLVLNKFIKIANNKTPNIVCQGINLNNIIAREQYKRGYAHKTYTELMNLHNFLHDKKSVKLVLKNGTVINSSTTSIHQILYRSKDETSYKINDCYDFKPRLKTRIELSELDYFQYGKQKYKLNNDNLTIE